MFTRIVLAVLTAMLTGAHTPVVMAQGAAAVTATFSSRGQPGGVVRLDVGCACDASAAAATIFDRAVPLTWTGDGWQGLIGIDLDVKPGTYPVSVTIVSAGATASEISPKLTIDKREFAVRRLRVAPAYVDPPPDVLARIGVESAELQSIFQDWANPRQWQGAFQAPVRQPPSSSFGSRSIFNGQARSPHSGTDFRAGTGTPVAAPGSGVIVLARPLYYTGNTVIIDHGLGLYSVLAHLSEFTVKETDRVGRGDVVGLVGATGRVTGPHLHWSVRLNGARVDPLSLLAATKELLPASQ